MSIKFLQLPICKLSAFLNSSDTGFDVTGFLYNDGVTPVATTDIGDICYATLEPRTEREELISFTIDSVTSAGVATITVTRGLSQKSPYGTGGATFTHEAGSDFVISNNPGLLNHFSAKDNDETITGDWKAPTPVTNTSISNKAYADTKVGKTGNETVAGVKTFSSSPVIPDATGATEAASKGQTETYADTKVSKTGDETVAGVKTFSSSPKIPDATSADEPFTKGQHDADAAASSAVASPTVRGSAKLDIAADTPSDPKTLTATQDRQDAINGGGDFGVPSDTNKLVTEDYINNRSFVKVFTVSGTYTKPVGAKKVLIELIGGGGGGSFGDASANDQGYPGGGGGLSSLELDANDVGASVAVTVGIGGVGSSSTNGSDGGDSSFGAHIIATGGIGGIGGGTPVSGAGGIGNISNGGTGTTNTTTMSPTGGGVAGGGPSEGNGGSREYTQVLAGGIFASNLSGTDGNSPAQTNSAIGGTGGGGGATNSTGTFNGGNGASPGGGGGGGGYDNATTDGRGGDGARGVAIVTTYF